MKKSKILYHLSLAVISIALVFQVVIIYWLSYPYQVIDAHVPYKTNKTMYQQGEKLVYYVDACKLLPVEVRISTAFIDGAIYYLPDTYSNLPVGCGIRERVIEVPHTLPPGNYHLRLTLVYKVNPIRSITRVVQTVPFQVK